MREHTTAIERLFSRQQTLLILALSLSACGSTTNSTHSSNDETSTTDGTFTTTTSSTTSTASTTSTTGTSDSCTFSVVRTGSEGEACDMAQICTSGEQHSVSCGRVGFFDFSCQCDADGATFVARNVDCDTIDDADFISAQCGFDLPGDGTYEPIVVTDTWEAPAFDAPPVPQQSCDEPTSTQDDFGCTWQSQCDASVALDCVVLFDEYYCRCLLDNQYYRQFTPGVGCDALDVEQVFDGCGFPVPE